MSYPSPRTCVATRKVHPAAELVRLCADVDGTVCIDAHRTRGGRGAWISPDALSQIPRLLGKLRRCLRNNHLTLKASYSLVS